MENERRKLKGWTQEVLECLQEIDEEDFTLQDVYQFEERLAKKYPKNFHVKDKIRQQLQILRDEGYVVFVGNGRYRKL